eukprot:50607-Amorphochlora_amoeboformis.AAC.2
MPGVASAIRILPPPPFLILTHRLHGRVYRCFRGNWRDIPPPSLFDGAVSLLQRIEALKQIALSSSYPGSWYFIRSACLSAMSYQAIEPRLVDSKRSC